MGPVLVMRLREGQRVRVATPDRPGPYAGMVGTVTTEQRSDSAIVCVSFAGDRVDRGFFPHELVAL